MATPIMIVGESGTGKSTSMRNLSPESTAIIQVINKPLPFKNNFKRRSQSNPQGTLMVTDSADLISKAILGFSKHGIQNIIIDDFQYLMANEFMKRSEEKGFQKFSDIEKISLEGLFTMVLGSYRDNDGNYQLRTQNNGSNTVKSPLGMFDSESIDNDLQQVSLKIHQYYGE